ncbi:hypothetical protein I316_05974 [Kwoniella heveanensis BCC8398]|uniref:RRM domain-containing protein n=1 Tax=Kwoniella heveanensis BCC8398 TaxID=1296120 RepID=A0A1B9GMP9_9TREE|nr:hypothetical protein I316_05974 [Kwoniella heveanensis BCC8398]
MATPPSSLPSPTPSSSSHSHFQSMSGFQPSRATSAASGVSYNSTLGREPKGYHQQGGGVDGPSAVYGEYQQPQNSNPYNHNVPAAFLPPVTSSPPPHPPPYVPPPQHAMAPDPIHAMPAGGPGLMGIGQPYPPPGGSWQGPGPAPGPALNGWRGPPPQGGYPSQQQPNYGRQGMPNGHISGPGAQLPLSPVENAGPATAGRGSFSSSVLSGMGPGPRPGSAHGEIKERRRDRERREKNEEEREDDEVISTIFVVGFPDDMPEREFQNIFTFAPGFEAATLKFPSGSSRREPTAALLAELTQLAANQAQAQAAAAEQGLEYPAPQPGLEEAMAAMTMAATASTSTSTTPSAAMSLTPSVPSGPMLGNPSNLPTRKQTIGFARFKTRADALAAREHLQGRKIDALTGATLKAEMAKKNLHTKRTTSGEELVGLLLRSGRLANLANGGGAPAIGPGPVSVTGQAQPLSAEQQQLPSAREAWDAWPNAAPTNTSERERQSFEDAKSMPPPPNPPQPSARGTMNARQHPSHALSQGEYPPSTTGFYDRPGSMPPTAQQQYPATSTVHRDGAEPSGPSNPSTSPSLSVKSPSQRQTDSKALLALAEEADELEGWSVNGAVGNGMNMGVMDGFHQTVGPRRGPFPNGSGSSYGGMGIGSLGPRSMGQPDVYGTSPPGGMDQASDASGRGGLIGGSNPADQNPPINTLYVGNLPAISPPTHPPNFLEESLRALFARSPGFKRMSFRQKINGPMCFVEFEEVLYASQAIKELYGHTLGGLVKGGIRLSYSKNSLGQRGNAHPSGINTGLFGGLAHTVALAGMSVASPTTATAQPVPINGNGNGGGNNYGSNPAQGPMTAAPGGPGYGLQLQQGRGVGGERDRESYQPPATAPISDTRRDSTMTGGGGSSSQGTSLSPTAQPFNISLPNPTSPRSRYLGPTPTSTNARLPSPSEGGGSNGLSTSFSGVSHSSAIAIPNSGSFQPFGQSSSSGPSSGFSPMSSPIRTPASFSWKSSGPTPGTTGAGFGFDFGSSNVQLGSLNGAASAWGAGSVGDRRD